MAVMNTLHSHRTPRHFSHVLLAKNHFDNQGREKTFKTHTVFTHYVPSWALAKGVILGTDEIGNWRCFLLIKATKKKKSSKKCPKDF